MHYCIGIDTSRQNQRCSAEIEEQYTFCPEHSKSSRRVYRAYKTRTAQALENVNSFFVKVENKSESPIVLFQEALQCYSVVSSAAETRRDFMNKYVFKSCHDANHENFIDMLTFECTRLEKWMETLYEQCMETNRKVQHMIETNRKNINLDEQLKKQYLEAKEIELMVERMEMFEEKNMFAQFPNYKTMFRKEATETNTVLAKECKKMAKWMDDQYKDICDNDIEVKRLSNKPAEYCKLAVSKLMKRITKFSLEADAINESIDKASMEHKQKCLLLLKFEPVEIELQRLQHKQLEKFLSQHIPPQIVLSRTVYRQLKSFMMMDVDCILNYMVVGIQKHFKVPERLKEEFRSCKRYFRISLQFSLKPTEIQGLDTETDESVANILYFRFQFTVEETETFVKYWCSAEGIHFLESQIVALYNQVSESWSQHFKNLFQGITKTDDFTDSLYCCFNIFKPPIRINKLDRSKLEFDRSFQTKPISDMWKNLSSMCCC